MIIFPKKLTHSLGGVSGICDNVFVQNELKYLTVNGNTVQK